MADAVDKMMTELRSACAKEQIVRSHHVIYAQEAIAALRAELEQVKRENQKLRGDCKAYEKTMEAIAAAEAAERLAGERVKALEWTRNLHGITQWAETPFGSYAIDPTRSRPMRFMWSGITGDWMAADTEAQAKAAAQADYERRILSALAEPAGEAEPVKHGPGCGSHNDYPCDCQALATPPDASAIRGALPATGPYVDRLIRIFRDRPDDDGSAMVLQDYARAALAGAKP